MHSKKIVITGAPGTGKTVVINDLKARGFHCYPEIIRDMTAEAKQTDTQREQVSNPLVFVDNPLDFNAKLLYGRKAHYDDSLTYAGPVCFFDRGVPDVLAYMDYFKQAYPPEFMEVAQQSSYNTIFILPPWEAIYQSDNERLETFAEAEALHDHLKATYTNLGYRPLLVPKASIKERSDYILETLGL